MPNPFTRTTRSLSSDSANIVLSSWFLAVLLLGSWLYWFFCGRITVYETSHLARLEVNYSAHPIASLVAGKIDSISIALGQPVQAGQILLTLDARQPKLALAAEQTRLGALPPQIALLEQQITDLEQAKLNNRQATQAALDSVRSRQKGASAAEAFARDYANRLAQLTTSGKTALVESLRAKAESERLSAARQSIAGELQRLKLDELAHDHQIQAEIDKLKRELVKLQGERTTLYTTIAQLNQDIEHHTLRAPAAGQVGDLAQLQIGAYVSVGSQLGSVVPSSALRIVADFPPAALVGRIKPGQVCRMRLDGFPWAQFGSLPCHVNRVGSEIRDNRIRVELTPEPEANSLISLQHGLPGRVEIVIEQVSPAILVLRKSGQVLNLDKPATVESN